MPTAWLVARWRWGYLHRPGLTRPRSRQRPPMQTTAQRWWCSVAARPSTAWQVGGCTALVQTHGCAAAQDASTHRGAMGWHHTRPSLVVRSINTSSPASEHCKSSTCHGASQLAGHMRQFTTRVTHVLPVSDDGGSTAEIVRVLGGPAVGDIRSRCLRLADDSDPEVSAVLCWKGATGCVGRWAEEAPAAGRPPRELALARLVAAACHVLPAHQPRLSSHWGPGEASMPGPPSPAPC